MKLAEILRFFDSVEYDHPDYPDQPGMVKCCGLPVVMRGGARVECGRCGRAVSIVGRQWMLTEDGTRGIPIRRIPNPESRMRMLDFIDESEGREVNPGEISYQVPASDVRRNRRV